MSKRFLGYWSSRDTENPTRNMWRRRIQLGTAAFIIVVLLGAAGKFWWYPSWQAHKARGQATDAQQAWDAVEKNTAVPQPDGVMAASWSMREGDTSLAGWRFADAATAYQIARRIYQDIGRQYAADVQSTRGARDARAAAIKAQQAWQEVNGDWVLLPAGLDQFSDMMDEAQTAWSHKKYAQALEKYQLCQKAFGEALDIYSATAGRFEPDGQSKYDQLNDQQKSAADKQTCEIFAQRLAAIFKKYQQADSPRYTAAQNAQRQAAAALASSNYSQAAQHFQAAQKLFRSMIHSVPDQYPTIQSAIDAAGKGDVVFLRKGVHAGPIKFKEGILLMGCGRDDVIIRGDPSATVLTATDCGSGAIAGITFEPSGPADANGDVPLLRLSHGKMYVSECRVHQSNGPGLYCDQGDQSTLENNLCEQNRFSGITSDGSGTFITVKANISLRNSTHGMIVRAGGNAMLDGNTLSNNVENGVFVTGSGSQATIRSNTCQENVSCGVVVMDGATASVEKNTCKGNHTDGIIAVGDGSAATIDDNLVTDNKYGIVFNDGAGGTAENNDCRNNSTVGIQANVFADHPVAKNNRCIGNGTGINFQGAGLIVGNTCNENWVDGILLCCESVAVARGNTCSLNADHGIQFMDNANATADGNICNQNRQNGICLETGSRAKLTDNTCAQNTMNGIRFQNMSGGVAEGNTCKSNAQSGISADGADPLTLSANTCASNHELGIFFINCRPTLKDNILAGNLGGDVSAPPPDVNPNP